MLLGLMTWVLVLLPLMTSLWMQLVLLLLPAVAIRNLSFSYVLLCN